MVGVPRSAFVTGGSGFIGGRLIERLAGAGARVRALARSDRSARAVEEAGAEAVRGDLDDVDAMTLGAEGCEVTFHLAAHVEATGDRDTFERINVGGTRNALEASRRAGVERLVHCSTEAVLLAGEPLVNADEATPRRPDSKAPYAATKARAEELLEAATGDGPSTVILRPRFVWGAGDTTLLPGLVALAKAGRLRWVDGGTHRTSTTHVDNAVEGLLLAAERGKGGEIYFVTDGEAVVFREFVSEMLSTQGVEPPSGTLPGRLAAWLALGSEAVWGALPLRGSPPLSRFELWVASQECTLDDSKARRELGYEPVRTRDEGLAELRSA